MKAFLKLLLVGILGIFVVYLLIPSPSFPVPLPDSPQSKEPGDVRDLDHKRAYFTDLSRTEVMAHYEQEFRHSGIFSFIPALRIKDYPPEEAFKHIDDQTLSNYLEELIFPLRESLFVNGYEPGEDEDKIAFEGRPYFSKVTVRYYESNVWSRLLVAGLSLLVVWWLLKEYKLVWKGLFLRE